MFGTVRGLFSKITEDGNKEAKIYPPKNLSTAKPPNEKGAIHRKHLSYAARRAVSHPRKTQGKPCRHQTPNHHEPEYR